MSYPDLAETAFVRLIRALREWNVPNNIINDKRGAPFFITPEGEMRGTWGSVPEFGRNEP